MQNTKKSLNEDSSKNKLKINLNLNIEQNNQSINQCIVIVEKDGEFQQFYQTEEDKQKYMYDYYNSDNSNCSICYKKPLDPKINTPCGHQACSSCWSFWFNVNIFCPRCTKKCGPSYLS
ncbi:zinc finger, C3HC4 type (RING finger) protein (macronuclear) [Tetrahymena thermophila SB210]|uniref:Zinc finger, C3HC4 type (RING finger) protein n=1 Tax=Tetrahymena thermophila (strain SB210) TaxID=312017 RepID=Q22XS1_TETTS|nr:zinc finger, C3HC4 type (RING finger) protein [Tetrahymena thermophila SB210]EAR90100.1 zinc finger, C3HC4 type (RING finger) protein [Tetrahymena thermophila SB210]|eukprot:XP_001010345.1 zinc finger, C3HC4 type (RING finger) protein [Tetrahymena thermophila SB210]